MANSSSESFFSLTQAEYAAGSFRNKLLEANMTASVRVMSKTDNVAGVKLPVFNQYDTGAESLENYGLAGGGRKIQACKDKFGEYLKALVKIASLQTSFVAMDEALKVTNRRVNALENVTLPKIEGTIKHIERELDELEREDFTRLKMVKKKKEEATKAQEKKSHENTIAASVTSPVKRQSIEDSTTNTDIVDVKAIAPTTEVKTGKNKKKGSKVVSGDNETEAPKQVDVLAGFEVADEDVVFK